jgi:hypothetical protein
MNLNDLLRNQQIDPATVIAMRHCPHETALRKVFPWLAAEKPSFFNAYQQTQAPVLERAMSGMIGRGLVASFIGHEPAKALFVGLYSIAGSRPLTYDEYWNMPVYKQMKEHFGMEGWSQTDGQQRQLLFDLQPSELYAAWRGKLVVNWPPPERSWWRRAHRNEIPVAAILEDSALTAAMPDWNQLELTWQELSVLPTRWRDKMSQWRGIYLIFDQTDGKGYVGSAYGKQNILGRWENYAARGDGGNVLLRTRNCERFVFTILERVSPDMPEKDVISLEGSWKTRLHSRQPFGLNAN